LVTCTGNLKVCQKRKARGWPCLIEERILQLHLCGPVATGRVSAVPTRAEGLVDSRSASSAARIGRLFRERESCPPLTVDPHWAYDSSRTAFADPGRHCAGCVPGRPGKARPRERSRTCWLGPPRPSKFCWSPPPASRTVGGDSALADRIDLGEFVFTGNHWQLTVPGPSGRAGGQETFPWKGGPTMQRRVVPWVSAKLAPLSGGRPGRSGRPWRRSPNDAAPTAGRWLRPAGSALRPKRHLYTYPPGVRVASISGIFFLAANG